MGNFYAREIRKISLLSLQKIFDKFKEEETAMPELKKILGPMRFNFLILVPSCVGSGIASAYYETGGINLFYALIIFCGALCAHISVNAFNEYFDFKSGLDSAIPLRTPFSGGTGTLVSAPEIAGKTLVVAIVTLVITALIGIYFFLIWGPAILPLGLLGLILIFFYTPVVTRQPLLSLLTPGLGFGPLMVMGTHFCLVGYYSSTAFAASLVPFFLVNNLLFLNQFPDAETDKRFGRKHFPIILGNRNASFIYATFNALAYLSVISSVYWGFLPSWCLLALLTVFLALPATRGAYRYADEIPRLMPYMGMNVANNIITPLLVALGLFIARFS